MKARYISLLFFSLLAVSVFAQNGERKKTRIHIENADAIAYSRGLVDAQRCLGNVVMRHDSTYFYCDSAYFFEKKNSFDAFGHIHIVVNDSVEIFSRTMNYDGESRFAEFHDDVRLMDDSTVLETNYLTYDRDAHLANYPNEAVTTRGDKTLVSKIGSYRDDIKELSFLKDVVVTSPKYQMYTDTLFYNTNIEKMWFHGPTTIVNEENTMQGGYGYYLVDRDVAFVTQKPVLFNETQWFRSDSIYYDRNISFAKAMGAADMIDTAYKVIMRGEYVELWKQRGYSFVTDSARVVYYDGGDSLYMRADTMFFKFKSDLNKEERIWGYRGIRFFKSDMQGKCDSLDFRVADSTIRMRVAPVLWTDNSQLTADSINIVISNHQIDSVLQYHNAFIISRDTIAGYNQIKGSDILSSFCNGNLRNVEVTENAQTIYWLREDDASLIGINVSKADNMRILMEDGGISRIKYYREIDETMFPEKELSESDRYLPGFQWNEDVRPKDRDDIFRVVREERQSEPAASSLQEPAEENQMPAAPRPHRRKPVADKALNP